MSELTKNTPKLSTRMGSESTARPDVAEVDLSGLARAIELMASGQLPSESVAALLHHELTAVQQQAATMTDLLHRVLVDLRQLRESAQREHVQMQDEQRQLQDQNDRFVANLIQEHDIEKASLRRERDAAIDRIRELSRSMMRASSTSSLQRVSSGLTVHGSPPSLEVSELKARIDELLRERERSLRLLRQLAEQRDLAESRLQNLLASLGPTTHPPQHSHSQVLEGVTPAPATQAGAASRPIASMQSPTLPHAPSEGALTSAPPLPALKTTQGPATAVILESPDDWDVVTNPTSNSRDPIQQEPAENRAIASQGIEARGQPSLGRLSRSIDRSGAYSMHGSELPADEVCLTRPPRTSPRST